MKSSEVLLGAARLVEDRKFYCGCDAIRAVVWRAMGGGGGRLEKQLCEAAIERFKVVAPANIDTRLYWWGACSTYRRQEHINPRIIGLCLAAAIAESEGD